MKHNNIRVLSVIIITLLFVFVKVPVSMADDPNVVAILPFNMNADRDLTFLQEGIMDMVRARLSWKGKVELLEKSVVKREAGRFKGPLDKDRGLTIGKALGADYVILGSLTVFGESVSIDASILDVKKSEELFTAFNQSKGMNEVIPTVNQFAQDINAKVMGRYIRPPAYASIPGYDEGPRSGLLPTEGKSLERVFDHVQTLNIKVRGIGSGDVDGDGKNELIAIDKDTVYMYRWGENGFTLFRSLKGRWSPDYVYVSVADLDNNGLAEIYVSGQTESDVSSFVLEYRSGKLVPVISGIRKFLKVIDLPVKGRVLIGQGRVPKGFELYVYTLKRDGDRLITGERLTLPPMANIFNFIQGSIAYQDKVQTMVLHSETQILFLFDSNGEELWRSDKEFGGSDTHMVAEGQAKDNPNWILYHPPMLLSDIDRDGQNEVVVSQNKSDVRGFLSKAQLYSSGKVHLMSWDGAEMAPKWETKKISGGPITGYCIEDVDNDGSPELLISGLKFAPGFISRVKSPKSNLVVYNLD